LGKGGKKMDFAERRLNHYFRRALKATTQHRLNEAFWLSYFCLAESSLVDRYWKANTFFQSFFMSMTVQPLALASSKALSSLPTGDLRS